MSNLSLVLPGLWFGPGFREMSPLNRMIMVIRYLLILQLCPVIFLCFRLAALFPTKIGPAISCQTSFAQM